MADDIPTMSFGDTREYLRGLSGRLGKLTRSVMQEFEDNENGKWRGELDYVLGPARQQYPSEDFGGGSKGIAPSNELVDAYTRDLRHAGWTLRRFWEAQPSVLRGGRSWEDRHSLVEGDTDCLTELEVIMLRLYTGPLFKTWNFFLRYGPGSVACCTEQPYHEHYRPNLVFCPRSTAQPLECIGCRKERRLHREQPLASWATSVALLYTGITKVATATTKPATVYRGVNEKRILLPRSFTDRSDAHFAGGVELAAMSTTRKREVASVFSGSVAGSIFEIDFSAESRGADLQFLSQYPAEEEMLYPPLTQLECLGATGTAGGKRMFKVRATFQTDTRLRDWTASIESLEQVPNQAQAGAAGPSTQQQTEPVPKILALFSAPLTFTARAGDRRSVPPLDLRCELQGLTRAFKEARRALHLRAVFATSDRLQTEHEAGHPLVLHFSGHVRATPTPMFAATSVAAVACPLTCRTASLHRAGRTLGSSYSRATTATAIG